MDRRLVVTGVDGFVGLHLARIATQAGFDVFGISRSASVSEQLASNLAGYAAADLREGWPTSAPRDAPIVHLAGLAAVGPSFSRPQDYISGNSAMVTHMCEALLASGSTARVVGVSTGAVYAQTSQKRRESDPVGFTSPYVVSKVLVESQLAYYAARGLRTVVARPFNHIGPGQRTGFLVPDLLARLRDLTPGASLAAGDLSTRRDYTDVRDVAAAYLALATAPILHHATYNVASGVSRSGEEILSALCFALDIRVPELSVDRSQIRATDPDTVVGDASRLHEDTGWSPSISFERTISDVVHAPSLGDDPPA